jgi:hypothetical protein
VKALNPTAVAMALGTAVLGVGAAGCHNTNPTSPFGTSGGPTTSSSAVAQRTTAPTSPSAQRSDYTDLLIKASDIQAPGEGYTPQPPVANPNGSQGAQILFTNQDQTRAIGVSLVVMNDAAAAPSALQQARAALATSVTGGDPEPSPVGTGGTVVSGVSQDRSKAATILLFTEGRAFARLEFDAVPGRPASPDFVADIGQKQDIALRVGLPG